jgi:hypothetical protein
LDTLQSKSYGATRTAYISFTVTEGANVEQYTSDIQPILSECEDLSQRTADKANAFGSGGITQSDFLTYIHGAKDECELLMDRTIRLQPPQTLAEAHMHIVKGMILLYSAYVLIEDGLTQSDASLITEGATFIDEATNEFNTALSIINSTT